MVETASIDRQDSPRQYRNGRRRPLIVFFDYPDVFEDFYPHYSVSQRDFATQWHNTANHAWLKIIQNDIGDVTWLVTAIAPELEEATHSFTKCRTRFLKSSWLHRQLWRLFYLPSFSWRWRRFYRHYAVVASYLAPLSWPLWRALKRLKPDILFVQDYCSGRFDILMLYAQLLGIPIVTFHSGSTPDKYLGKITKYFTIRRADLIFPSGMKEVGNLRDKYNVPTSKQIIIRPPVDVRIYRPMDKKDARAACGLNTEKKYLIFIGRLDDSVKRLSTIIDLFGDLAGEHELFDLLIVGSGNDETALRHQATHTIPGRIHFRGWIGSDSEKALILNASECLLLASWREASPAVIGEAFACGVPVISSAVGGIEDIVVPDETGWLFHAGDDMALKKRMARAMLEPEKIIEMGRNARLVAEEKLSIEAVTKAFQQGFQAVLNKTKSDAV